MNIIPIKTPTRPQVLDHLDDLLEKIKLYNYDNTQPCTVSMVVLSGHLLNPSVPETLFSLQLHSRITMKLIPASLGLDIADKMTSKEQENYRTTQTHLFDSHGANLMKLLSSSYVKINSLVEMELNPQQLVGNARIIFDEKLSNETKLNCSLNIKNDYLVQKRITENISRIKAKSMKNSTATLGV